MQMAELQLFGEVGESTLIEENARMEVILYPNPVNDYLNIKIRGQLEGSVALEMYDITGVRVFADKINTDGGLSHQLSTSAFSSGLYLLRLVSGGASYMSKVLIK